MNVRTLVAGETDKADLTCFLCVNDGLHRSTFRKNAVRIVFPDYFVELEKIDSVCLQAAQRLVDLAGCGGFATPVDLGYEKRFLPIAVAQRVAHADFALAAIVVPAVVEKIDSLIKPGADDANAFLRIRLFAKMIATEPND